MDQVLNELRASVATLMADVAVICENHRAMNAMGDV